MPRFVSLLSFSRPGGASRLDSNGSDDPWLTTSNLTLTFDGLGDGAHTVVVRAREDEDEGGDSDKAGTVRLQYSSAEATAPYVAIGQFTLALLLRPSPLPAASWACNSRG